MLDKMTLYPGQNVKNKKSGSLGKVRFFPGTCELIPAHPEYLAVRLRCKSGINKGKYMYKSWLLKNLRHQYELNEAVCDAHYGRG